MKMRIFLIAVLSIMLPQMAWGMDPGVRARHIRQDLQHLQKRLQKKQVRLQELGEQKSALESEYGSLTAERNALRLQLVEIGKALVWVQKELTEAQRLQETAQEYGTNADRDRALRGIQDKEAEKSQLQNRSQDLRKAINAFPMKEMEAQLADLNVKIHQIKENRENLENLIADQLASIAPEKVAPAPTPAPMPAPMPTTPSFAQQHKKEIGAIVTAIAVAIATYIGRRVYLNKKNRLVKKYKLGTLTPLQNAIWRATALAAIRMPWYLRYLVRTNPRSLTDLVGSDSRALAELYYGHMPSSQEVQSFINQFFGGVQ